MPNPSAVAEREESALAPQEADLARDALAEAGQEDLVLPILQVTQQLSRAVTEDGAEVGHFVNSLTGTDYGDEVDLVIASFFKGRFLSTPAGEAFAATGPVAPSYWPDEYAGKEFSELPDAEETFKARANAGEIEWGGGPPISTTYNFVGFIPDDDLSLPVRLSLMRTSTKAAQKVITLLRFARTPWDQTIRLDTDLRHDAQKRPFYVVNAVKGRQTTDEERQSAVALAGDLKLAQIKLSGDESLDDKPERRKAAEDSDGLDVA